VKKTGKKLLLGLGIITLTGISITLLTQTTTTKFLDELFLTRNKKNTSNNEIIKNIKNTEITESSSKSLMKSKASFEVYNYMTTFLIPSGGQVIKVENEIERRENIKSWIDKSTGKTRFNIPERILNNKISYNPTTGAGAVNGTIANYSDPAHAFKWGLREKDLRIKFNEKRFRKEEYSKTSYSSLDSLHMRNTASFYDAFNSGWEWNSYGIITQQYMLEVHNRQQIKTTSYEYLTETPFIENITKENGIKLINSFLELNKIPKNNSGKVWTAADIKKGKMPDLFGFTNEFFVLNEIYEIDIIKQEMFKWREAQKDRNGNWTNQFTSEQEASDFLTALNKFIFDDLEQVRNIYNMLKDTDAHNNYDLLSSGKFYHPVIELRSTLKTNGIEMKLFLNDFNHLAQTTFKFFKQNKIEVNIKFSTEASPKTFTIWENDKFSNPISTIPASTNTNTITNELNLTINSLNIIPIEINNQNLKLWTNDAIVSSSSSNGISKNVNFNQFHLEKEASQSFLYRFDAPNYENVIYNPINQNSRAIELNLRNRYVSAVVGTGINGNGMEYNGFTDLEVSGAVQVEFNAIIDANGISGSHGRLFQNINQVNSGNTATILNTIDFASWKEAWKFYGIETDKTNNEPKFIPNDIDGIFYAVMSIDNWIFKDGSHGDFTSQFKAELISKLNVLGNEPVIKELEAKNRINSQTGDFNKNGYFLLKFETTNKKESNDDINNPLNIDIQNEESINNQFNFINQILEDKSLWTLKENKFNESTFFENNKWSEYNYELNYLEVIRKFNIKNIWVNELKKILNELLIKVEFNKSNFISSVFDIEANNGNYYKNPAYSQFARNLQFNPIYKMLEAKILKQNGGIELIKIKNKDFYGTTTDKYGNKIEIFEIQDEFFKHFDIELTEISATSKTYNGALVSKNKNYVEVFIDLDDLLAIKNIKINNKNISSAIKKLDDEKKKLNTKYQTNFILEAEVLSQDSLINKINNKNINFIDQILEDKILWTLKENKIDESTFFNIKKWSEYYYELNYFEVIKKFNIKNISINELKEILNKLNIQNKSVSLESRNLVNQEKTRLNTKYQTNFILETEALSQDSLINKINVLNISVITIPSGILLIVIPLTIIIFKIRKKSKEII